MHYGIIENSCAKKGGFAMNILEERTDVQKELDHRICSHISRGSNKAYEIITTYHMDTIANIRNYMLDVLRSEFFYDARALNTAFNMAVTSLGINLTNLLSEKVNVVSDNKNVAKLAM
jgi:hypothetical protein